MSNNHPASYSPRRVKTRSGFREIWKSTLAAPVTSIVLFLVVALASCVVVLTAGRGEGAQAQILAQIDSAEIRSVTLHDNAGALGLDTSWVSELERYSVVEAVTGIGRTVDVTISANEDGTRVSASDIYTTWLPAVGHAFPTQTMKHPTSALASRGALQTLGFEHDTGVVRVVSGGEDIVIRGPIELPDSLSFLANSVIIPHNADESAPISSLVITTAHAEDVPLTLEIVSSYLTGHSPDDYSLESSTDLVNVREAVKGELTRNNYVSVLISLGVAAALAMTLVWAVVLLKRRDFGRRRALGASRRIIIGLVTGQMLLIATVGSISGTVIGVLALAFLKAPYPTIRFSLALIIAMTVLSTLASIVPALWAGNRDPLTELRVP